MNSHIFRYAAVPVRDVIDHNIAGIPVGALTTPTGLRFAPFYTEELSNIFLCIPDTEHDARGLLTALESVEWSNDNTRKRIGFFHDGLSPEVKELRGVSWNFSSLSLQSFVDLGLLDNNADYSNLGTVAFTIQARKEIVPELIERITTYFQKNTHYKPEEVSFGIYAAYLQEKLGIQFNLENVMNTIRDNWRRLPEGELISRFQEIVGRENFELALEQAAESMGYTGQTAEEADRLSSELLRQLLKSKER